MRQPYPWQGQGQSATDGANRFSFLGLLMAALIAIGVFIVAIFLLNLVEFGRLD